MQVEMQDDAMDERGGAMKTKVRTYEGDGIAVDYDAGRCIHVAECVRGLRQVFDPERRPWIDATLAPADAIAEVVRRCPTGALHYRRTDDEERPAERNEVRAAVDGPLYLSGQIELHLPEAGRIDETRVALCRCGASRNKPYCDNSHVAAGFHDSATSIPQQLAEGVAERATVAVTFAPDGPVLLDGPLAVCGADASEAAGVRCALCRCGKSHAKPFCDGSHAAASNQTG